MPPKLALSIPDSAAAAAAAADAEPDANRGAAPGGARANAPAGRTAALFADLSSLFAAQRAAGVDVNAEQDAASYSLDAGVRALMATYCADQSADWERCASRACACRRFTLCVVCSASVQVRLLGRRALYPQPGGC